MGLHFKLSRNRLNKDRYSSQLLFDQMDQEGTDQVYYIIPDNLKFESEVNTLEFLKEKNRSTQAGMIDLQVYSFTRLAWHLLQESVLLQEARLSQTGLAILVKKILLDLKEEGEDLLVYRGQEQFTGFVDKLATLLMELRNGLIQPVDLGQIKADLDTDSETFRKLSDLEKIYDLFIQEVSDKYIEQEDIFKALKDHIQAEDFSKTVFVIDHYENFSGLELDLIETLLENAKDVYIHLTLDKPYPNHKPDLLDLFYLPGKTYHTVFKIAQSIEGLAISTDIVEPTQYEDGIHPDVLSLENYWYKQYKGIGQNSEAGVPDQAGDRLQFAQLLTAQDEIRYVSNKIKQLVQSGRYRYKDILVIGRNLEAYANHLVPIFNQEDIPVFFDVTESMSQHPLVELVTSLIRIIKYNFQYEDVMRFLKTELFIPEGEQAGQDSVTWREKIDMAENVILAYGYQGSAWTRGEDWVYDRMNEEDKVHQTEAEKKSQAAANSVRKYLSNAISPLIKKLGQKNLSTADALAEVYQFMLDYQVKDRILDWRDQALAQSNIQASKRHEQAWQTFIMLVDEYIEVLGQEAWDIDEFLTLIDLAFENTEFSNVPPTLDQVTVTHLDQVRTKRHPVVFYIGMNDSSFPQSIDNSSILDDQDREIIQGYIDSDQKKMLTPNTSESLAGEAFVAYQAFSFASDYLFFSYSEKQDGENDHNISPYLKQVMNHFDLSFYKQASLDKLLSEANGQDIQQVSASNHQLLNLSLQALRLSKEENQPMHGFWAKLAAYFRNASDDKLQHIFSSLTHKNTPIHLGQALAHALYGKDLYLSVSQLETYYKDPYNHFLKYGLKLKERDLFELTPAESGSFYHDILDAVITHAIQSDLDIGDISEEEMVRVARSVSDQLLDNSRYQILSASNQMQFIKDLLMETIERRVSQTHQQFSHSKMKPYLTELHFGLGAGPLNLPAFQVPVDDQSTLFLRGKIDRVDLMNLEDEDNQYLQIVDYKSSEQKVKASRLYAGLSLQLLTYFNAVLNFADKLDIGSKPLKPLAALYSVIQVSPLKYEGEKEIKAEVDKKYKYNGIIIENTPALMNVDTNFIYGDDYKYSTYYQLQLKKEGSFSKGRTGHIISEADLKLLLKHNYQLIKQAGEKILSGELKMKPYYGEPYVDTVSGDLHAISQFDVLLPENEYNYLDSFKNLTDYIEKLKEIYSEGGEADGQ